LACDLAQPFFPPSGDDQVKPVCRKHGGKSGSDS
jgi:hypothetical protein